ncbi:MAG TPA: MBL fold metallo-hydrolase [Pyrinomonadaceae bacterium]|jgi:ribonuclease BN (tRNA processing enzyme)|nr:MBL fold metallo-hydrolase [Pyrinomonadaceae bacterium]
MRFVVLGSGTSVFHAQRAAAGFWLETEGGSLLLDCSADAPHRMAEEQLDWANLDAIWISHLHLDHCGGLASFLFGMKHAPQTQSRQKPLKIFGCAGFEKLLNTIDESHNSKLCELPFPLELKEISTENTDEFDILTGCKARAFSTPHRPESLALRLTDARGTTLVYTSDTGFSEDVAEFARGADLLVLECSFYRDKPIPTHLELADAMRIATIAEPRRLLLTHLYPEWDGIDLEDEAKKLWPGNTIAARDGLRLTI